MLNQGSGRDGAQLIMDTISCDNSNLFIFPLKLKLNNNLLSKMRGKYVFQQYSIPYISECCKIYFSSRFWTLNYLSSKTLRAKVNNLLSKNEKKLCPTTNRTFQLIFGKFICLVRP